MFFFLTFLWTVQPQAPCWSWHDPEDTFRIFVFWYKTKLLHRHTTRVDCPGQVISIWQSCACQILRLQSYWPQVGVSGLQHVGRRSFMSLLSLQLFRCFMADSISHAFPALPCTFAYQPTSTFVHLYSGTFVLGHKLAFPVLAVCFQFVVVAGSFRIRLYCGWSRNTSGFQMYWWPTSQSCERKLTGVKP